MFGSTGSIHGGTKIRAVFGAHLMHVVHDLRMPFVFERRRIPRLRLRENIPVAIIVVAHIVVIQFRRRRPIPRRPARLPIPLGHDVHAIRILRGSSRIITLSRIVLNFGLRSSVSSR